VKAGYCETPYAAFLMWSRTTKRNVIGLCELVIATTCGTKGIGDYVESVLTIEDIQGFLKISRRQAYAARKDAGKYKWLEHRGEPGIVGDVYRAVDSSGETIDFMLSPQRDLTAAKLFLRLAYPEAAGHGSSMWMDTRHMLARLLELKRSGELGRRCSCRPTPYLNNVIEQDHRFIKKRIAASLWFRSVEGALRTIEGYEAMHLIRKGQIRWLQKGDVVAQRTFIRTLFGIAE
jgi:hypothetical protein